MQVTSPFDADRSRNYDECPFNGGMNQLWRNLLLASSLETSPAPVGVVVSDGNLRIVLDSILVEFELDGNDIRSHLILFVKNQLNPFWH